MPSQQYQYNLVFNTNFYKNHYIEIQKLAKSYGLQGNISGFCFTNTHEPIVIQSFFDRIFNNTGSISNLHHQLTWMIKIYNFLHQFKQNKK